MNDIEKYIRPLLTKVLTRGTLWLLVSILGTSAIEAEETATQVGAGVATILIAVGAYLLDRWHHKKDLAETPKSTG